MEYAGCIYHAPVLSAEQKTNFITAAGEKYPFDLTKNELQSMRLVGLPIRLEHTDTRLYDVGRTTDVKIEASGRTSVKFKLHDTPAGWATNQLIGDNTIRELSLGHEYSPSDGSVEAKEISIVFKGARPGSFIYKHVNDFDNIKVEAPVRMEASDAQNAAPPAEVSDAPAPVAVSSEPAQATEAARESAPAPVSAAPPASSVENFLNRASAAMEPELQKELFENFASVLNQRRELKDQLEKVTAENKTLNDVKEKMHESHTNLAKEITTVMKDLYEKFLPKNEVSDETCRAATEELVNNNNPNLMKMLQPIQVMASAIHKQVEEETVAQKKNSQLSQELDRARQAVSFYERTWEQSGVSMDRPPLWQKPDVTIAVNASAADQPSGKRARTSNVPGWLSQQITDYESGGASNRLYPNSFQRPDKMIGAVPEA